MILQFILMYNLEHKMQLPSTFPTLFLKIILHKIFLLVKLNSLSDSIRFQSINYNWKTSIRTSTYKTLRASKKYW